MREQHGPMKEQHGLIDDGQNQPLQHFANYDLIRRIDVGGMGEVYLARQRTAFGREVAVKIIRSDLVHDIIARKRFLREAEVSAHLKHDHILPLIEFSEEQGRLFLVTPYIKSGTLSRRLQSGPLPLSEVHQLFSALVQAVSYVHKRGVVHRDLKPSNILLDQDEGDSQIYVRLIDFGIASIQGTLASPPLTTSGREMGTAAYMAPERFNGIAAPSNDIYSLGVILYQMLTGDLPVTGEAASLPQSLEYVVRRCIMPDPAARFATGDELLKAFEQACSTASIAPGKQTTPVQEPPLPLDDLPMHRPITAPRLVVTAKQDSLIVPHIQAAGARQGSVSTFSGADYNAPTSFLDPQSLQERQQMLASEAVIVARPPQVHAKPNRSLVGIISVSIAILLILIAGMGYLAFQAAISANVTIAPQVKPISKVFTMTAKPTLHSIDTTSASLPAGALTSSKTASLSGETTGRTEGCFLFGDCQPKVTFFDVDSLAAQMRQGVRAQIAQDLQKQAQAAGATTVGNVFFTDGTVTANPPVDTISRTVTVNLTEQGSVEMIKTQDVRSLAQLLLQQQIEQNYVLMDQMTRFGQPVIQNVDANGNVKIAMAVASAMSYKISGEEKAVIQNHVAGMKLNAARAFIATLPGIDAQATAIHISYGDTIPKNTQQIKVVAIDPSNVPSVQLPAVQSAASPSP